MVNMKSNKSNLSFYIFIFWVATLHCSAFSGVAIAQSPDYDELRTLLKQNVEVSGQSTKVNYSKIKKNPSILIAVTKRLSAVTPAQFKTWNQNEQISFLINSYNAYTIQLIVDHYPVKSIRKIGGAFGNPWKLEFFSLLGEKMNLDHIEHEILRKKYKEPRIHFALNCASIGCPPLQVEAFESAKLEQQLEAAAKHFIRSSDFNRYVASDNKLYLSSIFKWYGQDFGTEDQLRDWIIKRYFDNPTTEILKKIKEAKVEYLDYDWSLNETK